MARHLQIFPEPGDLAAGSSTTLMLGVSVGGDLEWKTPSSVGPAGISATKTFYAASTSGGATDVLNTVVISSGIITSWTQQTGAGLDTASKRGSMIHTLGIFVWYLPVPDGTIAAADRKHLAGMYSGV